MAWSTRFATQRLLKGVELARNVIENEAPQIFQEAGDEAADWWANRVKASGRAPGKGMDNITARVTQPRSGGFFVRMGWLDNPPLAADGKTTWFVYQDVGYNLFGRGTTYIQGLMLQTDARSRLTENKHEAAAEVARRSRRALGRG